MVKKEQRKNIDRLKNVLTSVLVLFSGFLSAQTAVYNTKKGFAANGYDVVSYFDKEAKKGQEEFSSVYDEVRYKFANQENLEKFEANPKKYMPQYGGFCAYAMGISGKKVSIDPKTFELRNGKLYLFYNKEKTNTLELWLKESPGKLKIQADKNWENAMHR